MKMIYLYGPPASGKLTIAKQLAKMTGYKLFHNHLINDVALEIMPLKHEKFWKFTETLKLQIFDMASKFNVNGIIFTHVYSGGRFPRKVKRVFDKNGDNVYFVKLEPESDELMKRVGRASRKKSKKISSKKELRRAMLKRNLYSKIDSKNQLVVNNSKIPAKKVAVDIIKKFRIKKLKSGNQKPK